MAVKRNSVSVSPAASSPVVRTQSTPPNTCRFCNESLDYLLKKYCDEEMSKHMSGKCAPAAPVAVEPRRTQFPPKHIIVQKWRDFVRDNDLHMIYADDVLGFIEQLRANSQRTEGAGQNGK